MTDKARSWTIGLAAAALCALPLVATAQTYPSGSGQTPTQSTPSSQASSSEQNTPQFHLDEAKRVLDSIQSSELSGDAASQVSQIKSQFNDLYSQYKSKSGSASSTATSSGGTATASSSASGGGQTGTSGSGVPPAATSASGSDWKSNFDKIENELDALNVPKSSYAPSASASSASGTSGTSGSTSGTTGGTASGSGTSSGSVSGTSGTANVTLPSDISEKLEQFRMHLEQFYSLVQH